MRIHTSSVCSEGSGQASLVRRLLAGTAIGLAVSCLAGGPVAGQGTQPQTGAQPLQIPAIQVEGEEEGGYKVDRSASPKQTAPLIDTPQTIQVIPQAIIEEQNARTLTEVLRNVPGISFNAGENGFATSNNNFSLRGFDTSGSIFVDGVRDSGSYARDIFNLEQVEVAKGPAADNGRGSAGGYINLVTKTPTLRNFARGGVSFGFDEYDSDSRKRTAVDANYAVAETTAVRLNLMLEDSGIAGREHANTTAWGLAPSITTGLGTDFRATLAYEHVDQDDRPDWGVPGATVRGMQAYDPSTDGVSRDKFYGLKSDFDETARDTVLARLEYDLSGTATLSNQTRWTRVDREARYTLPTGYNAATGNVTTQTQFYSRVNTILSNQTDLSTKFSTGPFGHTVSSGVELTREKSDADRFGTSNSTTGLFDPDPDRVAGLPLVPAQRNVVRVDTLGLYAYDTVEITRQWEVTGGLRAEHYNTRIASRTVAGAPSGALDGYDESKFTLGGKVGLVYKPVSNGSIYTAFGTSTLPPGSFLSNPDISRTGNNAFPGFVGGAKTVRSYNYEIGTKWNLMEERLSFSAALFRTEKTNVPITGRDAGETADSLKGYGKQVVQGIELGMAGKITDAWSVFGGVVMMNSERQHSAYLDEVRRRANPADYGTATSTDGDELAFTPNYSGNLWTTYRLPFGLTVGGGMQYVGSSYLGRPDDALRIIANGTYGKLPSYTLFHAMASYEVHENAALRLNVDNITDEKYATSANWPGTRAALGPSRAFMLSLDVDF